MIGNQWTFRATNSDDLARDPSNPNTLELAISRQLVFKSNRLIAYVKNAKGRTLNSSVQMPTNSIERGVLRAKYQSHLDEVNGDLVARSPYVRFFTTSFDISDSVLRSVFGPEIDLDPFAEVTTKGYYKYRVGNVYCFAIFHLEQGS